MLKFEEEEPETMTNATKNAAEKSSFAEHSINNKDCARKHEMNRIKIINSCISVF